MFERKNKSHTAAFDQINPVYSYQDDKVIFRDGRAAFQGFSRRVNLLDFNMC